MIRDTKWLSMWWHTLVAFFRRFSVKEQMREILSFSQVLSNVQAVYDLRFPTTFLRVVGILGSLISFNPALPPLACLGIHGYAAELQFFMLAPFAVAAVLIVGSLGKTFLFYVASLLRRCLSSLGRRKKDMPQLTEVEESHFLDAESHLNLRATAEPGVDDESAAREKRHA